MQKDIKLIVPDSLHEIELGQYQEYLAAIENLDATEDVEQINRKLIETFCGLKPEQVNLLPLASIESLLGVLSGAFSEEFELIRHFELDGVKFGFIPKLDEMSLGEYIDLESTFGDWEKMHKAMAILYRVVNFEKGEKYDIVSYETNEELAEAMKMMPLSVVMSCIGFFLQFRDGISASYVELYTESSEGEQHNVSSEGSFGAKWGWYQSIYGLAQGDVRRFDEITALPLHQCLTFLAFEKEKNELEAAMIKKQYK